MHIVEDDAGVRDSLAELIRSLGFQVVQHQSAEDFTAFGIPGGSDTVIVDLGLPGAEGASVIRRLRRLAAPPRVIAISGQTRKAIDAQLSGLDVPIVLEKPLMASRLAELL